MPKPVTSKNGAASDEKFAAKLAAGAGHELAALGSLAVVSSLLSQLISEIAQSLSPAQKQISEHMKTLVKTAEQSASDPEQILKSVFPEINAMTESLEQICSKQVAFWAEISQRLAAIGVLRKMLDQPKATNASPPKPFQFFYQLK